MDTISFVELMGYSHKIENGDHVVSGHGMVFRHTNMNCIIQRIGDNIISPQEQSELLAANKQLLDRSREAEAALIRQSERMIEMMGAIRAGGQALSVPDFQNGRLDNVHFLNCPVNSMKLTVRELLHWMEQGKVLSVAITGEIRSDEEEGAVDIISGYIQDDNASTYLLMGALHALSIRIERECVDRPDDE